MERERKREGEKERERGSERESEGERERAREREGSPSDKQFFYYLGSRALPPAAGSVEVIWEDGDNEYAEELLAIPKTASTLIRPYPSSCCFHSGLHISHLGSSFSTCQTVTLVRLMFCPASAQNRKHHVRGSTSAPLRNDGDDGSLISGEMRAWLDLYVFWPWLLMSTAVGLTNIRRKARMASSSNASLTIFMRKSVFVGPLAGKQMVSFCLGSPWWSLIEYFVMGSRAKRNLSSNLVA